MPEPRCHLRESQDLSVYEWEEMVEEFTQHASHSIITHLLCFWVKYQSLFSLHGFDLLPRLETDCLKSILWKVFRSLSLSPSPLPPPQRKRGLIWPRPSVYWDSCSDDLGPQQVPWFIWTSGGAELLRFGHERQAFVYLFKVHLSLSKCWSL